MVDVVVEDLSAVDSSSRKSGYRRRSAASRCSQFFDGADAVIFIALSLLFVYTSYEAFLKLLKVRTFMQLAFISMSSSLKYGTIKIVLYLMFVHLSRTTPA